MTTDIFLEEPSPDFERLRTVLLRQGEPDRLPQYELFVDMEVQAHLLDRPVRERVDTVPFYYHAGYDYVPSWPDVATMPTPTRQTADTATIAKAGGRNWAEEDRGPITTWDAFEQYAWLTSEQVTFSQIAEMSEILPDGMKLIGQMGGILEQVVALMGYTHFCYALADQPDLVEALFERVGRLYLYIYERLSSMPVIGAVVISDDMGFKTQPLISPAMLRRYVFPWQKRFAALGHAYEKPVILHSCGNLESVMDDLIDDVGIDAKHSYEDVIMPVTAFKAKYGDRLAVLGGIDMDVLCRASEPALRTYVAEVIAQNAPGGGWALGSGNTIANYVPVGNYAAMLDQGRKWTYD
jgi:uroporphyrinogen decarboxylase